MPTVSRLVKSAMLCLQCQRRYSWVEFWSTVLTVPRSKLPENVTHAVPTVWKKASSEEFVFIFHNCWNNFGQNGQLGLRGVGRRDSSKSRCRSACERSSSSNLLWRDGRGWVGRSFDRSLWLTSSCSCPCPPCPRSMLAFSFRIAILPSKLFKTLFRKWQLPLWQKPV